MLKTELKTRYKTNYHLELVDSRTGEVKQVEDAHNIFLSSWWNGSPNEYCTGRLVRNILFGSGTGTPSESDGGCFRHLWTVGAASETQTMDVANRSIKMVATATVAASTSYVGTITEICCDSCATAPSTSQGAAGVFTHALLKDAEGNPLAIVKTDVDILKVTITIEVSYASAEPWKMVKYPGYLMRKRGANLMGWAFAVSGWVMTRFCLGTTSTDSPIMSGYQWGRTPTLAVHQPVNDTVVASTGSLDRATKRMTFGNVRIATSVGASRPLYFNFVMFTGLIYTRLPNPELFPSFDIEGIDIGLGDGEKTQFANPLDYFVKDTERIFKDDALLVRGVDYTIDYQNNHNRLPELAATRNCELLGGVQVNAATYNGHKQMLFKRFVTNTDSYLCDPVFVGWRSGLPFEIKLDEPVYVGEGEERAEASDWSRDVNTFYCPGWVATGTITVLYSQDREEWVEACVVTHVSGTANLATFEVVNAPYWRIEGTNTGWTTHTYTTDDASQEVFLGYVGDPYVTFTEAPGEGAVLRMNVQMDRPFKNGNFVIDLSAVLQLS